MKSAVYIGPWFDTIPMKVFTDMERFVLIDCQPIYCSSGSINSRKEIKNYDYYEKGYLKNLNELYEKIGYQVCGIGENYVKFRNENNTVIEINFATPICVIYRLYDTITKIINCAFMN
jgi:hypothetical protein